MFFTLTIIISQLSCSALFPDSSAVHLCGDSHVLFLLWTKGVPKMSIFEQKAQKCGVNTQFDAIIVFIRVGNFQKMVIAVML